MQTIEKLTERVFYMTPVSLTDRPVLGLIKGKNKTVMIDAGNSVAHANEFLEAVEIKGGSAPDIVLLTHWHWDHIFGLSALKDAVSIASVQTKAEMAKLLPYSWSDEAIDARVEQGIEIKFCADAIKEEYKDSRNIHVTLPDVMFEQEITIDLGDVTCVASHIGGDHAADSVIVYVKEEKILFLGDCLYAKMYAEKFHYTIPEMRRVLAQLEMYDADIYIASHQMPFSKDVFLQEVEKLRTLATLTERFLGDARKITEGYEAIVQRPLEEHEIEAIAYFVDGF